MKNELSDKGYEFDKEQNIWIRPDYEGIPYSDGDVVEKRIGSAIAETVDLSVLSPELKKYCKDWPSLYHLSSERANILRPFAPELKVSSVLEIGAGCGAITRYLGETCAQVIALEGSPRRAAIAKSRVRDLPNVTVVSDRFDMFDLDQKFDFVTLIGVLEYAGMFMHGESPVHAMLDHVRKFLKPNGKVIIAIENQLGLKYFAGAPEDHLNQMMYGIEGRYLQGQPQTYGRRVLERILSESGFASIEFMAPFPDYKMPCSIVTEKGFLAPDFDASALAWQSVKRDPQLPEVMNFSMELAWQQIFENKLCLDLANSFLIAASPDAVEDKKISALAYHYSTGRLPRFCKETLFVRDSLEKMAVKINWLCEESYRNDSLDIVSVTCSENAGYEKGVLLSKKFIKIVSQDDWSIEDLDPFFVEYLDILRQHCIDAGGSPKDWEDLNQVLLPGRFMDLVPQNIVQKADGRAVSIDQEWILSTPISLGHLIFRAVLWMTGFITRFGHMSKGQNLTRGEFLDQIFKLIGLQNSVDSISTYNEREVELQSFITGTRAEELRFWHPELSLPTTNLNTKLCQQADRADTLEAWVRERDEHIATLQASPGERGEHIATLQTSLGERDTHIATLQTSLGERDTHIATLQTSLGERDGHIATLQTSLGERDGHITTLQTSLEERDTHIATLQTSLGERDEHIATLQTEKDHLQTEGTDLSMHLDAIKIALQNMKSIKTPSFNSKKYLKANKDVAQAKMDPLIHHLFYGQFENRSLDSSKKLYSLVLQGIKGRGGLFATVIKAIKKYRDFGVPGIKEGLRKVQALGQAQETRIDYSTWIERYDSLDKPSRSKIRHDLESFKNRINISVVMPVYNPPVKFLEKAIQSVCDQLYPNWELCIADDHSTDPQVRQVLEKYQARDSRIKVIYREQNGHISAASNSAIDIATGDYIALIDHDDELTEHALYWVVKTINEKPGVGLIYSDEDKITETGERYDPYFKPELDPFLLLAQNMISHLGVYRSDLVRKIGGFRKGLEGSQDYDLALRMLENMDQKDVIHIPRVLYHWRAIPGSTAVSGSEKNYAAEAGRRAVEEHLKRTLIEAMVVPAPKVPHFNRVIFKRPDPPPLLSIIIPTRDKAPILKTCVNSIFDKTTHPNYEIIVIDNGSVEKATLRLFSSWPKDKVRVIRDESPFNFSALNNHAVKSARGELICLMNNDIEIITPNWAEEMTSFATMTDVGCVGARLWYPNGRLQHGGVFTGFGGVAGHAHRNIDRTDCGYFGRAILHQSMSAVTGACLMIRRTVYEAVGGLDEKLVIAFNDIDFCLRVREAGYRNIWTPYAEMIHHESISRGAEDNEEKVARFNREIQFMKKRWGAKLLSDPAYNPNLTIDHEDFSLASPPRVS